jgi:hypothetical protein
MQVRIYILMAALVCGVVSAADEATTSELPEPVQRRLAEAQALAVVVSTEEEGIARFAIMAHDKDLPEEARVQCLEAIIARHAAAQRAPALADTVDTLLRLFPELPAARGFALRLQAGRLLSAYALALPEDAPERPALCARADADLVAATQIQQEQRPDPEVRVEALHWLAESLHGQGKFEESYKVRQRLIWDYPETTWARIHRAVLVSEQYERIAEGIYE